MVSNYNKENDRCTDEQFPQPPRFIEHEELTQRGLVQRLFKPSIDPPAEGRLTHREELVLFKRLQYAAYRMGKMWDRLERLNPEEQNRYLDWHHRYTEIRERIIAANMGLVFDMLSKNRFKNVEFEELRSEGLMALLRSVDTYNPWSGFRFSTYACNSILHAFSRMGLMHSKRQHLWSNSYEPSMEPSEASEGRQEAEVGLIAERLTTILNDAQTDLSDSEKFVIQKRFPLHPEERKATLKSVGQILSISKERVRQIQESALSKLRRSLKNDPILQ